MDPHFLNLSRFNKRLKNYFVKDPVLSDLLEENYFFSGQNIRTKICLEMGSSFGLDQEIVLDIATFTEFLHNASLIHDDIIDNDSERRGYPTIWKKYGGNKALLLGDLLIAKSYMIASSATTEFNIKSLWVQEISSTVATAVKGTLNELEFHNQTSKSLFEQYFAIAIEKTGVLFSLPIRCIAIAGEYDISTKDCLTKIFSKLAVAYQIKDDQADFLGSKKGRNRSSDLINGRPNIYHLLVNSKQPLSQVFTEISRYQNTLIESAIASCAFLPTRIDTKLEELLIPFVTLKPLPSFLTAPAQMI